MTQSFPTRSETRILFAHPAYQFAQRLTRRETGLAFDQATSLEETQAKVGAADVLVISGLWRAEMLAGAQRLRFIQACGAGFDQFDLPALEVRGVALCNGSGVNVNAVSEHAMALILAHTRLLPRNRDDQRRHVWHPMIADPDRREDELAGKTLLIYGLGAIGSRLARLARAFDMRVIGIKRRVADHDGSAHEVRPPEAWYDALPAADVVALTCPLTTETRNLIDARALSAMAPQSFLVNVARGGCVDEPALIEALRTGAIAGAGIDTTQQEPLSESSPLWDLESVILTPHSAGETRKYEDNVLDILLENLARLWRGETALVNRQA